ncbi:MAG: LysE family transporter [Rhodospirillales bacterium]|nr:LysE family transporter [Alphaproteobacteria bacterium]MCB9981942.1 LysE family transporter [Rhodospirillales bacterium]
MEFFIAWLVFASVQLAATMSPGPAFAMQMRNIVKYGRRGGIYTAIGLGAGVGAHVAFVLCGLAAIMAKSVTAFALIKYVGAAYLIYIGIKALKAKPDTTQIPNAQALTNYENISAFKAFQIGLWTNVLNPKAVVFFTAIFTQFIAPNSSSSTLVLYGLTSVAIEILWFSSLAIILTVPVVRHTFRRLQHWIERICGGLLLALGVRLALSKYIKDQAKSA